MGICLSCGATLAEHATFCTACGTPASVPGAALGARRSTGKTRPPWVVLILTLVTLGFYSLYYWWVVSKEVDGFTSRPGHAHDRVKLGMILAVAGGAIAFVGILGVAGFSAAATGRTDRAAFASGGIAIIFTLIALALLIPGGILLYMGYWRVWSAIRADERLRNAGSPLSPGLMLAFFLIPYVNLVTMWIAIYRTQKGLNGMWAAERSVPALPAY